VVIAGEIDVAAAKRLPVPEDPRSAVTPEGLATPHDVP
jgi:hypothetical protein